MLTFYNAYDKVRTKTCKDSYINDFAAVMEQTFENSSNVFYDEIEMETFYGSGVFNRIPVVRVDSIISYNTGTAIGDDFKNFLFTPDFTKPSYGTKFRWGNNYWLVINTNNAESMNISAEVRRCNNQLRFFDESGNKVYEPCILDYNLVSTNNDDSTSIVLNDGSFKMWCQRNDKTSLIRHNDVFLFGTPSQRVAFRISAGGIRNMLNTITADDSSATLNEFYVETYQINKDTDDLIEGFANAYKENFYITLDNISTNYPFSTTQSLTATVYKNDNVVTPNLTWESSDEDIATITTGGVLTTGTTVGTVGITVYMTDNKNVSTNINLDISNTPTTDVYEVVVTPNVNYILQNEKETFDCWLYKNGIKQTDDFLFYNVSVDVPFDKYEVLVIDDNHFSVENKGLYMDNPVLINCVSGTNEKTIEITLRGLY